MKCAYCNRQIKSEDETCPHCGAPIVQAPVVANPEPAKKQRKPIKKLGLKISIFIVSLVFVLLPLIPYLRAKNSGVQAVSSIFEIILYIAIFVTILSILIVKLVSKKPTKKEKRQSTDEK